MVWVKRKSGGVFNTQIAAYTYDALGRRIRKVIPDITQDPDLGGLTGDIPAGTTDYLYDGVQCIEERDPTGGPSQTDAAIRQYVWGQYVDELIRQIEIDPDDSETITATYYMLSDLLYRATALTNASGTIQEAYDCDAYGNTIAYSGAGTGGWWSDDETATNNPKCQFIFTGRRFDPETSNETTQMYFYRARYYSPVLGRFISRDPIGYNSGMNLYEYVGGMATRYVDPPGFERRIPGRYEPGIGFIPDNPAVAGRYEPGLGFVPDPPAAPPTCSPKDKCTSWFWIGGAEHANAKKKIREFAESKAEAVEAGKITSCEALADIWGYAAGFYKCACNNDEETYVEDVSYILAGVNEWATTTDGTHVGRGIFNDSGFKRKYQDRSNQVQHFSAAVQAGFQYEGLAYIGHRVFRPDTPEDTALNDVGITLGRGLSGIGYGLDDVRDYILVNVCDPSAKASKQVSQERRGELED